MRQIATIKPGASLRRFLTAFSYPSTIFHVEAFTGLLCANHDLSQTSAPHRSRLDEAVEETMKGSNCLDYQRKLSDSAAFSQ